MGARGQVTDSKLQGSPARLLAVGVVALEFAAAVSTFVAGTLLPLIERDLSAQRQVPLLLAGGTIGMFVAVPLAARVIGRWPSGRVLSVGLSLSIVGNGLAACAPSAWLFFAGRLVAGAAGALLAVFGYGAAIRHLEDSLRLKVVAAMSAMWIVPATVGPSLAVGVWGRRRCMWTGWMPGVGSTWVSPCSWVLPHSRAAGPPQWSGRQGRLRPSNRCEARSPFRAVTA